MATFYQTEIVYKWYRKSKDDADGQATKYTILDKDKLTECQETIRSISELAKWLGRKRLPPDGYTVPFDGVRDKALIAAMFKDINRYRNVKRCYAALKDGTVYEALHEAVGCFLPTETREEQTKHYIEDGVPDFLAERMGYTDEAINLLLGKWPQYTNALAAATVLCCMWKDIEQQHDEELQKKYGLKIRDYGKGTAGVLRWWSNPAAIPEIRELLEERRQYILKGLFYYRRKYMHGEPDAEIQSLKRFPGSWLNAISKIEQIRVGPQWPSAEVMLDYVLAGPDICVKRGMDDIVNAHLSSVRLQIDSGTDQQYLVSDSIVDAMYAYLSWDLQHGLSYKKCLCCDTYFVVGNHDRKYCDAHMPPNGQYQRKLIYKKLEETAAKEESVCKNEP